MERTTCIVKDFKMLIYIQRRRGRMISKLTNIIAKHDFLCDQPVHN
jgi:hypothetical protein